MSDLDCPYCGHENEVCHDDGFGYDQDYLHEMECCKCEKYFTFTTTIHFSYEPYKADCLNGGVHQWKRSRTYPYEFTRMDCVDCEETRKLTEKEWVELEKEKDEVIEGGYRQ